MSAPTPNLCPCCGRDYADGREVSLDECLHCGVADLGDFLLPFKRMPEIQLEFGPPIGLPRWPADVEVELPPGK